VSDSVVQSPGPPNHRTPEIDLTCEEAEAILRRLAAAGGPPVDPIALPGRASSHLHPLTSKGLPSGGSPHTDRAAEELLETESFRSLLEAVPDAVVLVNVEGLIVRVNGQAERLFDYRREDLVGQPIELLVPERSRDRHITFRDRYFVEPHVRPMGVDLDLHGRRRDGHEVPVEISLSPLRIGACTLVVSTIRDVSTRKRAESQLRKLEARYRTLVEGIPAVTFLAALDDSVNELYVSPQIEELLGFSQQEWLENPILWYSQLHPEDRLRWHQEFSRTCALGEPFRSVYRFVARDGRIVWVQGEAKIVRDEAGEPFALQGVAFDITAIKEAEAELKALNQTLEQRVHERTLMAEQRSQELSRSNGALEQFGYVVAHDLRAPLRTIKSYTQKLAERCRGQLDAESDDYVQRTVNAAERMRILIDDLLAYSRVRTQGKEPAPIDCNAIVAAARANLQEAIEESGAAVTSDRLPTVLADETQLVQLFQNLIGNALKFRAERPPHIHVGACPQGESWLFAITDNGIGIEAPYLQRIFGLGERLHTISKYPGNGIGLATCEKIVQRHGGRIWATSAGPGQGSTFSFTLPAAP
jgi:PAS domain S-box-containing protein